MYMKTAKTKVLSEGSLNRELGLLNFYEKIKRRQKLQVKMQKCIYNSLFVENMLLHKKMAKQGFHKMSESELAEDAISKSGMVQKGLSKELVQMSQLEKIKQT